MEAHTDIQMSLKIESTWLAAEGIRSFELVNADGADLPAFTAGSHIKVQTPAGQIRRYSLCNNPTETHRYVITVKREQEGRGGSLSLVDQASEGDFLKVSMPENAFPLVDDAEAYLFVAAGIGITPIMAMIQSLYGQQTVPWKLWYLSRRPETTAFLGELSTLEQDANIVVHHTYGDPDAVYDLWPIFEKPQRAHIYCCGPRRLMEEVRDMTGHWPQKNIHFESFVEGGEILEDDSPFHVRLQSTGARYEVPVGETIMSVLRQHDVILPSSCESGTCGTCRLALVSGEPDHRDMVLMDDEMDSFIMPCVSRALSEELVLDL